MKKIRKILLVVLIVTLAAVAVFFVAKKYASDKNTDSAINTDTAEAADELAEEETALANKETLTAEEGTVSEDEIRDYEYSLYLDLDTDNMTMDGKLDFTYYNNNDIAMDELVFYLYANSFEKEEYYAIEPEYFYLGYPNGFSPGKIEIKSVDAQGGCVFSVEGSQNHLLVVMLENAIKPDESTKLSIEYKITIPNSYGRFGYGEETISLVNCNPIMAVYSDETGYYDYEYNNIGDPFYSECADYTAQITVPKGYLIAPTGTIVQEKNTNGKTTYFVNGENRRDFGFVASDDFEVASTESGGVQINSYSFSGRIINSKALEVAVNSIDIFSELYGDYPYETFNVVETNFYIGGMEYPGMVMIGDSFYNFVMEDIMEVIIAHEAAHQWWYAQVGNDQIAEPWLDEALATFSERVYYERVYPKNYDRMIENYVDDMYIRMNRGLQKEDSRIDLNTLEYGEEYSVVVYGFGSWMIEDLRDELGDEIFFAALRAYLEDNRFQIATREDLEDAIEAFTGEDITGWFDENLQVQVGY